MSSNVEGKCDFCTERVVSRYFKDGKSGHKRCLMSPKDEGSATTMTPVEKQLLQDLVDISISAQKVLKIVHVDLDNVGEVIMLHKMTEQVINMYCTVKGKGEEECS